MRERNNSVEKNLNVNNEEKWQQKEEAH